MFIARNIIDMPKDDSLILRSVMPVLSLGNSMHYLVIIFQATTIICCTVMIVYTLNHRRRCWGSGGVHDPPEVPPLGCSGWVLRSLRWSLGVPYMYLTS